MGESKRRKLHLGATGNFPRGMLNADDEGELKIAISRKENGTVVIDFGKKLAWISFPPDQAIEFAKVILKQAGATKIEIEGPWHDDRERKV